MKNFKDFKSGLVEGHAFSEGDDMTNKELKIAINSARSILDMLDMGILIQRWQISAIVKASDELASVYTSMHSDHVDQMDDMDAYGVDEMDSDEYDNMYINAMYGEETDLEEKGPAIKKDFFKTSRDADRERNAKAGLTPTGRKKKNPEMSSTQRSMASMRKEETELDEAATDYSALFDSLKKGDIVNIKYDSVIKKGSQGTFKVTFKSVVGKTKVGKITMTRQGDDAGKMKYYLYNRNGNVVLAIGDMGASMTSLVKESVELDEDYTLPKAIEMAKKSLKSGDSFTSMIGLFNKGTGFIPGELKFRNNIEKDGYNFVGHVNKDGSVSLKKGFAVKESVELDEATASIYKDMPKAPGKMLSNRVQVKAFKDVNAMGAFLSNQNDNSWKETGVAGLKSGKYKIDMVSKGGNPSKNFIKVNEEIEGLDELSNKTLSAYSDATIEKGGRDTGRKLANKKISATSRGMKPNAIGRELLRKESVTQLDELGNKYVMDKKDLADVQTKLNTMDNPPKIIKDKSGYFHLRNGNTTVGPFNTMKDVLKKLGETN
jgi:hypothetical protein